MKFEELVEPLHTAQKNPFHLADAYAQLLGVQPASVLEPGVPYHTGFHWTERHLQCLWYDERYRPRSFPLPGNETAQVLSPGEWNLEAGPDFLNATLLIQPGDRRLCGDIEVHVRPTDWDTHGHQTDPAYDRVVAHVTWFAGPPPRSLPAHVLPLALAEPIAAMPGLSLDDIDLKAYPHAALPATPRPCEARLKNDPDRARALLAAAGHYRLQLKAARLRARLAQTGDRHQLFYEEVMAALGYKHNQMPFRHLARLLPVASLGVSRENAYARLLGAARLLPQPEDATDPESQRFIRMLWDLWWRESSAELPDDVTWRLHNLRPQNAPVRRLAVAASLFSGMFTIRHELDRLTVIDGVTWHAKALECLTARCAWSFWNVRLTLTSAPEKKETALLGTSRAAAIVTNVLLPFAAAEGTLPDGATTRLPPEDISAPMRLTALYLFGRDHNPAALYADNGLLQQGLLQVYLDFCLNAKPGCDACALCDAL